jgi:putative restriction endonuclease
MYAPNSLKWEVEAAHIVPHGVNGKNDIWNGIAPCGLHHWAFDVGWFSFSNDYRILVSSKAEMVPDDFGTICGYEFFKQSLSQGNYLALPKKEFLRPHENSIEWHRKNIFCP